VLFRLPAIISKCRNNKLYQVKKSHSRAFYCADVSSCSAKSLQIISVRENLPLKLRQLADFLFVAPGFNPVIIVDNRNVPTASLIREMQFHGT
jgi:hypothetical protein